MAPRFSSEPRSTSSWLRRDDAPSVMDSMESSSSIWSMRILADSAISAKVASAASNPMSSGRAAPDGAAGRAGPRRGVDAGDPFSGSRLGHRLPPLLAPLRLGVGVGGEQHRGVALGVEHFHCAVGIFGQLEGVGGQSGDGRRRLHADLDEPLHAQAAGGLFDEQQVLGFDPAHRAGELPRQQLDEDRAGQLARALVTPGVVVGEDLVERLGGHQITDLLDEVAVQRERPRHQVGDVAPDDQVGILVARHDPLQRAAEVGDTDPQHPRVERHVDAGHQDERALAAADLAAPLHLGLQRFQTAHRAGDRVLRAAQVEVHDLEKFAGALGDFGDERGDLVVGKVDLRRPDRRQPVVGAAQLVARHDVVHLRTAVEHHLQQGFQLVDARHAGQRRVLADRVTARDGTFDEGALLAHLGDLRGGHRRHRHLGELRQVQHALGVVVVHAAGDDAGRVVAHHVQHREAQRVAGELVGVVPHLAGRLGAGPNLHAHALVLDALAGERVDRLGGGQPRGRRHHQIRSDARGYFQNLCALVDSDAVDPEVDLVARTHHAQESRGPADQPRRRAGLTVGGGHRMLCGGRQPHAVHDGRFQARQQRGRPIGVNGVVVTGHHRERAHVDRCGQRDVAAAATRGVGRVLRHRAAGPDRIGELGGTGASEDRETLLQGGRLQPRSPRLR